MSIFGENSEQLFLMLQRLLISSMHLTSFSKGIFIFPQKKLSSLVYQLGKKSIKSSLTSISYKSSSISGESFLSIIRRNQDSLLDTIRKPLKLEKSFLHENRSEFHLQYDAVKNNYEQGEHKVPF